MAVSMVNILSQPVLLKLAKTNNGLAVGGSD